VAIREIDESDVLVGTLQNAIARGEASWENVPGLIIRIINENRWQHRIMEFNNQEAKFTHFEQFVQALYPEGLETSMDMLKRMCSADMRAVEAIDGVVAHHQGARTDLVDNINEVEARPTGTSQQAAIRRLRKHRPDLLEDVKAGKLSAHAAMIQAGLRQRSISIPDDPKQAARRLKRHFDGDRWKALIKELQQLDS
jgi:hypothetical protein